MADKDIYDAAYKVANRMVNNKEDLLMQELGSKLSDRDYGTLRDRLADAFVAGQLYVEVSTKVKE